MAPNGRPGEVGHVPTEVLLNWAAVGPELARTCRVLALDLAGFGRTRGGERSTSVHANQQLLHRFLTEVAGVPAGLVGNSTGGLIAVLQAAGHPETVAAAVLVDSALPVGPRARAEPLVAAVFTAYAVPAVGRAVLGSGVLGSGVLGRRRRCAELMRAIQVPVLLLHGEEDRLVPLAAARAAAGQTPAWRFAVARDVGHVPQLEAPEWTVAQIRDWLGTDAAEAADRTRRR